MYNNYHNKTLMDSNLSVSDTTELVLSATKQTFYFESCNSCKKQHTSQKFAADTSIRFRVGFSVSGTVCCFQTR